MKPTPYNIWVRGELIGTICASRLIRHYSRGSGRPNFFEGRLDISMEGAPVGDGYLVFVANRDDMFLLDASVEVTRIPCF